MLSVFSPILSGFVTSTLAGAFQLPLFATCVPLSEAVASLSHVTARWADFTGSATVKLVRNVALSPSLALALIQIHCGAACSGEASARMMATREERPKRRFMGGRESGGVAGEPLRL